MVHIKTIKQWIHEMGQEHEMALQNLHEHLGVQLFHYIKARVENREAAEDIYQEVLSAAWNNARDYREEASPLTWLYAIVRHKVADHLRHREKERQKKTFLKGESIAPPPGVESMDLRHALLRLKPDTREAIYLIYYVGLTYNEAGELLQLSPGTVKSRVYYGRQKLYEMLVEGGLDIGNNTLQ